MASKKIEWTYKGDVLNDISKVPKGAIGFIYKVYDLTNHRYYVGRKMLWKMKKSGAITTTESNWKVYKGSSKELNEVIKNGAKYRKEITQFAYTKAELTFLESSAILCGGALTDSKSYNSWMKCTIYKKNLTLN